MKPSSDMWLNMEMKKEWLYTYSSLTYSRQDNLRSRVLHLRMKILMKNNNSKDPGDPQHLCPFVKKIFIDFFRKIYE